MVFIKDINNDKPPISKLIFRYKSNMIQLCFIIKLYVYLVYPICNAHFLKKCITLVISARVVITAYARDTHYRIVNFIS